MQSARELIEICAYWLAVSATIVALNWSLLP